MGGILDMSGNKITNLAYPTESLDSANKKYVDESLVFKKIKIADNLDLSFSGEKSFQINYPSGFTVYDILNVKFVLYEFFNLSLLTRNDFCLGLNYQGVAILNLQTSKVLDKVSYSIPVIYKTWISGQMYMYALGASGYAQIMGAQPTNVLAYFYCNREVTGKVSIYFIM